MAQGQKLNQVIAVEKGIKARTNAAITSEYHVGQKLEPFLGIERQYARKNEDGEQLPPERKLVQKTTRALLKAVRKQLGELFDVTAAKDYANCNARADVKVDGTVVLKDAPVTYLLFVEKYLTDLHTIVDKLPTLTTDEEWTADPTQAGIWKSKSSESLRTNKEVVPLVLYGATEKHPAQTDKITKDVAVGTWTTIKLSGAMAVPEKEALIERIERMQRAVKYARESANMVDAPEIQAGEMILGWLFAGKEG